MNACETETVRMRPGAPDYAEWIERAGKMLRDGGLVAFPTETVYGLAANAERSDVLARLREVKGRPEGKPFSFIVCERSEVARRVGSVPPSASALMDAFWPGPLTLVLRGDDSGTVGFRMPDEQIALDLIRAAGVRLVAPSANSSGGPEPQTARDVARDLAGRIELILDGGRTRMGQPSTVVLLENDTCRVLRAGAIEEDRIREAM